MQRTRAARFGTAVVPKVKMCIRDRFFHCAKALMRSHLWDPATQVERKTFPTLGKIIADQTAAMAAPEADDLVEQGYRNNLYCCLLYTSRCV